MRSKRFFKKMFASRQLLVLSLLFVFGLSTLNSRLSTIFAADYPGRDWDNPINSSGSGPPSNINNCPISTHFYKDNSLGPEAGWYYCEIAGTPWQNLGNPAQRSLIGIFAEDFEEIDDAIGKGLLGIFPQSVKWSPQTNNSLLTDDGRIIYRSDLGKFYSRTGGVTALFSAGVIGVTLSQTVAATDCIVCASPDSAIVTTYVSGNGGAINLTSNPQICTAGAQNGDKCTIIGDTPETVQLDNGNGIANLSASHVATDTNKIDLDFSGSLWIASSIGGGSGGSNPNGTNADRFGIDTDGFNMYIKALADGLRAENNAGSLVNWYVASLIVVGSGGAGYFQVDGHPTDVNGSGALSINEGGGGTQEYADIISCDKRLNVRHTTGSWDQARCDDTDKVRIPYLYTHADNCPGVTGAKLGDLCWQQNNPPANPGTLWHHDGATWRPVSIDAGHGHLSGTSAPTNPCTTRASFYDHYSASNGTLVQTYICPEAGQNWEAVTSKGDAFTAMKDGTDQCTASGAQDFSFADSSTINSDIPSACGTRQVTHNVIANSITPTEIDETQNYSFTTLSGKIDRNNISVDDDDCTGEQGLFWYDTTDSRFEYCNDNSGVPAVLGASTDKGAHLYQFGCQDTDNDSTSEWLNVSGWNAGCDSCAAVDEPCGSGTFAIKTGTLGNLRCRTSTAPSSNTVTYTIYKNDAATGVTCVHSSGNTCTGSGTVSVSATDEIGIVQTQTANQDNDYLWCGFDNEFTY